MRRRQLGRRPRRRRRRAQARRSRVFRPATSSCRRRDLLFQRGAVFRHRLADPADGVRAAEGDLPGFAVEAQEAVVDAVEAVAAGDRRRRLGGTVSPWPALSAARGLSPRRFGAPASSCPVLRRRDVCALGACGWRWAGACGGELARLAPVPRQASAHPAAARPHGALGLSCASAGPPRRRAWQRWQASRSAWAVSFRHWAGEPITRARPPEPARRISC